MKTNKGTKNYTQHRKLKRQSKMDNPETLTTQDEDKQRYKKLNITQKTKVAITNKQSRDTDNTG